MAFLPSRRFLAMGLIAVTTLIALAILSIPTSYNVQSYAAPVQSIAIIQNLQLFVIFLFAYVALAFAFAYWFGKMSVLFNLIILCSFSSVWIGYWIFNAPYGRESLELLAQTVAYQGEGTVNVVGWGNLSYLDFPGLFLVAQFLWDFCGINILVVPQLLLWGLAMMFSLTCYVAFRKFLADKRPALIACMFLLIGGLYDSSAFYFQADSLGLFFVALFIAILAVAKSWKTPTKILFLLVLSSALLTNLMSSVFIFIPLVSLWVLNRVHLHRGLKISTDVILSGTFAILAYLAFVALFTFSSLLSTIFQYPLFDFGFLGTIAVRNFGPGVPQWVSLTRIFAYLVTIVIGGLIILFSAIYAFFRRSQIEIPVLSAIFFGFLFGSLVVIIFQSGAQIARPLLYLPLIDVIPLVSLVSKVKIKAIKVGLPIVMVTLLLFSVPAFLGGIEGGTYAAISRTPADQYHADVFMQRFNPASPLMVFSVGGSSVELPFFLKHVTILVASYPITGLPDPQVFVRASIFNLSQEFDKTQSSLWLLSQKDYSVFEHLAGVGPGDPLWNALRSNLDENNFIYSNRMTLIFESIGK